MEYKLYQLFAGIIDARKRCQDNDNLDWYDKHTETINKLIDYLPHGSGLDYTWHIDFDKSHNDKLVFYMSYHAMDENGYYDGIIDFTLIVKPSLTSNFTLHIRGNFGKYSHIKDYLYDILNDAFNQTIDRAKL